MPAVTVRNIPVKTHEALKRRAQLHGKSTEAEIRLILEEAVRPEKQVGLGTELHEIAKKYGGFDLKIERNKRPARYATFE
jgi:plasmid stability protein